MLAPSADKMEEDPTHIAVGLAEADTFGFAFTVNVYVLSETYQLVK